MTKQDELDEARKQAKEAEKRAEGAAKSPKLVKLGRAEALRVEAEEKLAIVKQLEEETESPSPAAVAPVSRWRSLLSSLCKNC
jgi:hypothetical protein